MPALTTEALYRRVGGDPVRHLGERSPRTLGAYSCGYEAALAHSADEVEALGRYLALWSEALAHVRETQIEIEPSGALGIAKPLIEQLRIIGLRPGMYFGSSDVACYWAFVSGFGWAEQDLERSSMDVARLRGFQTWMDERYRFGRGVSWARTIRCLAMQDATREHACFFEHLDMFLAGADADAADPTMLKMVAAIVEHASSQRPGGSDDEPG